MLDYVDDKPRSIFLGDNFLKKIDLRYLKKSNLLFFKKNFIHQCFMELKK
ncbi:hypothetical protein AB751O23_AW_00110 [Chlamydiales bacterium SCGC AB-751-O23]|nr:hypothetical protein AB751O23_AW_00110 [Chlamydiales bacterium SCGC AB-751-O23]